MDQTHQKYQTKHSQRLSLAELLLWPGDAACNLLKIEDQESRMLFRMFINLTVYGKLVGLAVLFFA